MSPIRLQLHTFRRWNKNNQCIEPLLIEPAKDRTSSLRWNKNQQLYFTKSNSESVQVWKQSTNDGHSQLPSKALSAYPSPRQQPKPEAPSLPQPPWSHNPNTNPIPNLRIEPFENVKIELGVFIEIIREQIQDGATGEELITELRHLIDLETYFLPYFSDNNTNTWLWHHLPIANVNRNCQSNTKYTPVAIKLARKSNSLKILRTKMTVRNRHLLESKTKSENYSSNTMIMNVGDL